MPETPLTFIKGDSINSESSSPLSEFQRAEVDYRDSLPINMEAIEKPLLGAAGYMHQTPGLRGVEVISGVDPLEFSISRGAVYNSNFLETFRVFSNNLYSIRSTIDNLGNLQTIAVDIGEVTTSQTRFLCFMPYSFNSQAVLADGTFSLYDPTVSFFAVEYDMSFNLVDPVDVVWIDGYYFFTNGEYLYHTFITDETQIDPLAYNGAELFPDKIVGLGVSDDNKVIVFGRYSIEFFQNAANPEFAFTRLQSRQLRIGLYGKHLKCNCDGNWYFVGSRSEGSLGVYAINGGTYRKVSTREVDRVLQIAAQFRGVQEESMLECRIDRDKKFLILHLAVRYLGVDNTIIHRDTLVFDLTIAESIGINNAWSYLTSASQSYAQDQSDVPYCRTLNARHGLYDESIGQWTYGLKSNGSAGTAWANTPLALLDYGIATHYDDAVEWRLDTPFYALEGRSIDEIEIETAPGWTQTNDASVFLSLTYNGVTHTQETIVDYGQMQQYGKRFIRRRLGYIRDWFSIRLRGVSKSRVLFGAGKIKHD